MRQPRVMASHLDGAASRRACSLRWAEEWECGRDVDMRGRAVADQAAALIPAQRLNASCEHGVGDIEDIMDRRASTARGVRLHVRANELDLEVEVGIARRDRGVDVEPVVAEQLGSALVSAADLLGVSDILGSISKGKIADIVAVDGDPLQDIRNMKNMSFVMKEGKN